MNNKGKHLTGAAYNLRGLVHYCHGENHGSEQVDMKLEKGLRVLHFNLQAVEGDHIACYN